MALKTKENKKEEKAKVTKPAKTATKPATKVVAKKEVKTTAKNSATKTSTKDTSKTMATKTAKPANTKEPAKKNAAKTELKGKFAYYKTAKGNYNYRLKASNNETIAVSGGVGYATLSGCKAGIESVRKNINAKIEDQTLRTKTTLPNPKFELFCDKAGKFRYRLLARNGELICASEGGYATKDSCKKGIESLAKWALNSDIVSEDK